LVRNVTRSLDSSSFNICISEMMIYINECYKNTKFYKKHLLGFLSILSCFAPFISEEINIEVLKNKTPISQTK
jgi:leucyl-tRNA synthetase